MVIVCYVVNSVPLGFSCYHLRKANIKDKVWLSSCKYQHIGLSSVVHQLPVSASGHMGNWWFCSGLSLHICGCGLWLFALLGFPACSGLLQFVNGDAWWLQTGPLCTFHNAFRICCQNDRYLRKSLLNLRSCNKGKHVTSIRRPSVLRCFYLSGCVQTIGIIKHLLNFCFF